MRLAFTLFPPCRGDTAIAVGVEEFHITDCRWIVSDRASMLTTKCPFSDFRIVTQECVGWIRHEKHRLPKKKEREIGLYQN